VNRAADRLNTLADLNADGRTDIALGLAGVAISGGPIAIAIYRGDGRGSFTVRQTINAGINSGLDHETADLNGDGHLDLVYGGSVWSGLEYTDQIEISFGTSSGAFEAPVVSEFVNKAFFEDSYIHGIEIADADGDGRRDLVGLG
jgi:hypothetical protein